MPVERAKYLPRNTVNPELPPGIEAVIDGVTWNVPETDNAFRQMIALWEAEGNTIAPADPEE